MRLLAKESRDHCLAAVGGRQVPGEGEQVAPVRVVDEQLLQSRAVARSERFLEVGEPLPDVLGFVQAGVPGRVRYADRFFHGLSFPVCLCCKKF